MESEDNKEEGNKKLTDLPFASSLFKIKLCANFQSASLLFHKTSTVVSTKIGK